MVRDSVIGVVDMAKDTTVRIDQQHREYLKEMSGMLGKPASTVLQEAIRQYRTKVFLEEVNRAYSRLRKDEKAWAEYMREIEEWDVTLADGLEDE
jgi:predicted DNA-binding protein